MDEKQFPALTRREIFKVLWGGVPPSFIAPALLTLALTLAFIVVSERNYRNVVFSVNERRTARDNLDVIDALQMTLLNAETGQRGYLLTGNSDYLKPLTLARTELFKLQGRTALMFSNQPDKQAQVDAVAALIFDKFVELEMTVKLVDQGRKDEALQIVTQNGGKDIMDRIRQKITALSGEMSMDLEGVRKNWEHDMLMSRLGMLAVAILNLLLLAFALYLFVKDLQQRQALIALRETENQRLAGLVDERTSELNELSTHLQRSIEEDRAALARDLHDELGGILTSAKMDLEWLRTHATHAPEALKRFVQLSEMLDDAVSVKRRVVENLRPSLLDNLGLAPALEWYITEHCNKGGLKCTLNLAEELGVISPDASIALFRIVQEGTTNALRHAKAKHFNASLHIDRNNIHLVLEDDGAGLPATFNPAKMSHGLSGIRQRARSLGGDAIWKSAPGKGTTITVIIPRSVGEADAESLGETAALA
jgi:signal transduction histidine kinase